MSSRLVLGAESVAALRPQPPPEPPPASVSGRATRATRAVLADRRLAVPVGVLALLVLFAIFAPILWPHDPDTQDLIHSLQSPSWSHPMGTDQLGRDVFARVAAGARISLLVATLVTLAGALIGGSINTSALGLDAAAPAIFLALLWPQLSRDRGPMVALGAVVVALALVTIAPAGVPIIAAAGVAIGAGLLPVRQHRQERRPG